MNVKCRFNNSPLNLCTRLHWTNCLKFINRQSPQSTHWVYNKSVTRIKTNVTADQVSHLDPSRMARKLKVIRKKFDTPPRDSMHFIPSRPYNFVVILNVTRALRQKNTSPTHLFSYIIYFIQCTKLSSWDAAVTKCVCTLQTKCG